MATSRNFPNIQPSSRSYTPGEYPQTEFIAQNGAKTILRYGNKRVNAKLTLGFTNISDTQANELLEFYYEINADYDYAYFTFTDAFAGIQNSPLYNSMSEKDPSGVRLRYRFDGPPTITSVKNGISNVQCKFVACLDGD